ncbi:hypothetical protein Ddc_03577 [Ditylenchus destructor]|nr:hypothetical protein Ddc_03577 [Ditylenchus destructor]
MHIPSMDSREMKKVLMQEDNSSICILLKNVEKERQFDVLLSAVLELCSDTQLRGYELRKDLLDLLGKKYFSTLGALSAYELSRKLVDLVKENKSRITAVHLLRALIFSTQILNATKLREFVKKEFVTVHADLFSVRDTSAAIFSLCIFYTLVMELSYSTNLTDSIVEEINDVWNDVLSVEDSEKSAVLQFASFMFYSKLDNDVSGFVKNISRHALLCDDGLKSEESISTDIVNSNYDFVLMEFLISNLSIICLTFPKKRLSAAFDFLIRTAAKYNMLEVLANQLNSLSNLRYDMRIGTVEATFFGCLKALPFVDKNIFLRDKTIFEKTKQGLVGKEDTSTTVKQEKAPQDIDWNYMLSLCDEDGSKLRKILPSISSSKLKELTDSLLADYSENKSICEERANDILKILNSLVMNRREFSIKFHPKITELFMNESGLKTESLFLAAKIIETNKNNQQIPIFISFCLGLIEPITTKHVSRYESEVTTSQIELTTETVHQYMVAKLTFLTALLWNFSGVAKTQVAIISSLIPDFFVQLSRYKEQGLKFKSEQLEQKLSTLCTAITKLKDSFHKFIPLIISCSLTGEREMNHPTYLLLSICDDHDLAVLATNLPPQDKKRYANIQSQFYARNKIIG